MKSERVEELLRFISTRASAKVPGEGDVSLDEIKRAIEVAITAPSAHNAQPWRFIVVKDPNVKEEVLREMASYWEKDLRMDGLDEESIRKQINDALYRSMKASAIIFVCMTMEDMHRYPDERRMNFERAMAIQSVAAAIENMLLAFHAMGISACWRSNALFAPEAVRKVLNLPENFEPQASIEVFRGGIAFKPPRKPLYEVACLDRWGNRLR